MKLIMNRKGEFKCNWTHTENMCGTIESLNPIYSYHCVIETGDILDGQDFVFDQLEVNKYFQEKYKERKTLARQGVVKHAPRSCERIAIDAVNDIKSMLEKHMLDHAGMSVIYRIAVTISFGEHKDAMITAEWLPDGAKPIANVKKVSNPGPTATTETFTYNKGTSTRDRYGNIRYKRTVL